MTIKEMKKEMKKEIKKEVKNNEMAIKDFQKGIDRLYKNSGKSSEISDAIARAQEAIMWLEKRNQDLEKEIDYLS